MRAWAGSIFVLLWLCLVGPANAQGREPVETWSVLHCGVLLAVPGQPPLIGVTVIVKGGRIYEVRSGFVDARTIERPADVEIATIDLRNDFVLPGLIDAHVHLTMPEDPADRAEPERQTDAWAAIRGVDGAARVLAAGITTVRNLGSTGQAAFALRDAIDRGVVPGPRMFVAGAIITATGGHGDPRSGSLSGARITAADRTGVADGTAEIRRAVRTQVLRGADVIKIAATGGVLSDTGGGIDQQLFEDEMRVAVETAHLLGRRVAAHAHGREGIKAALRAGVDSVEHGTFLDEEAITLFLQRGAVLVPTLVAADTVYRRAQIAGYYPPKVERKALEVDPKGRSMLGEAHARGVAIAFGTDSGVSPHGENAREFVYLVEAGLSEMEAIQAATVVAARLLGVSDQIGTIEPGKAADLIATAGNPLVDITALQRVNFVMKAGRVFQNEAGTRRAERASNRARRNRGT